VSLHAIDPDIARAIDGEMQRQREHLTLVASENHCPPAVREAVGSVMTDKYAEGYPGARYYGGCERVDDAEGLAVERITHLFGAEHGNVQPHSGSQANMAVYMAMLGPGAQVLGMSLAHGGHLTHGHPRSFSGQLYEAASYGVDRETGLIDYDQVRRLAQQHNPALIIAGSSAYSRTIDFGQFGAIAEEVGAYLLADIAHIAGLVAAGLHPSPIPHADLITGTTHKTLRGPRGGFILSRQKHAHSIDSAVMPGIQGGPMMHVIAGKAVCFKLAATPEFRQYQTQVLANARAMADELAGAGFSLVSGGTDNHMLMVDLTENGLSGIEAQNVLARAHITLNKNAIPYDRRKPSEGSGIRIGTPAVTTRGLTEPDVRQVARWIAEILLAPDPAKAADALKPQVLDLCERFPIP